MQKRITIFFVVVSFLTNVAIAQNKELTIEDAVWNQWFSLAPEELSQLSWKPESYDYTYVENWTAIEQGSIKSKKDKNICVIDEINKQLKKLDLPTISYFYNFKWLDDNRFVQTSNNLVFIYNVEDDKLEQTFLLPEQAENIFYNKKANAVAYTLDNNLQLMKSDGKIIKISDEDNKGIVYGSDYVHRQEFGIDHGIFWSPNGKFIAFYRKDETMVADYPLVDYTTFPATVKYIKYPMIGQTSEQVTLGIYDLATGKITYMNTGTPKDHYLTAITWDPSEKYVYIGILNRDQNHLKFNKYDTQTGNLVKTLFEEKNDKYVEPEHPAFFLPKSKNKFLWYSERDGYNHLYLYDTDGNLIRQVTKGTWVVTDFYGISPDEKYIYIQSTAECPIQRHIYKVNMQNGKMTDLTPIHGYHSAQFSYDFKYLINDFSNIETPHITNIKNSNGKITKDLINAENPLADYKLGKMKLGTIKAADGKTDLYYRLITPPDFDSTKKYPVIVYVYGGPHAQLIDDSWLASVSLWQFYMAQKGYVMFTLDNRGSANRGFAFESAVFRHLGVNEMKDQLEGVKFLKSKPYIDTNRMGVHGWSFGGFMTTSLMTTYPDVFKVAVAGGPVIDWKYYEVMYGERYMDTPETNPDGFKETSILNKIENLKGKLLIIHGGVDPVVVPQNSMDLLLKAQENGIQIDFYTYPNSEHNVRGRQRIHLMQKITDYFLDYL